MGIKGIAARTAAWSARHRVLAVLGWLVFVVATVVLSGQLGVIEDETGGGHGESARAEKLIDDAGFPERSGEMVLVRAAGRSVDDPEITAALGELAAALDKTGVVLERSEPIPSPDGTAALVTFAMADEDDLDKTLDAVAGVQKAHPTLSVRQTGDASGDRFVGEELDKSLNTLALLSLPLTLGILLIAFGALVAALLPVVLAVTAVIAAAGLLAVVSRAAPTVDATMHVMLLIGLAVGVDYCLFYIRREREERARGVDPERALMIAAQTSGRSVWISGLTVIVAMAGMLLTGDVTFMSFGAATILVVATAVIGSLTVLPAMLSLLGDKIDLGRIRRRRKHTGDGRAWRAVLGVVTRHPLVSGVLAAALLGALAFPALRLNPQSESLNDFTAGVIPTVDTMQDIQRTYPGAGEPAEVVIKADDVTAEPMTEALEKFRETALATGQLHEPISVQVNPDHTLAIVTVGLSGSGTDETSEKALLLLRDDVLPKIFDPVAGVKDVAVAGNTAGSYDFNQALEKSLPLVFAFVLGLTFLLVLLSFRSIVVAFTTIVLNLLSVAAAYGVLVLVFQDGHGEDLLKFTSSGGITDWLPLLLFVILFGLSMDYHVFVLSRIREGYDRGLRTRSAVAEGIAGTAGTITSAAVVMVIVFGLFATMPLASMKQVGVGLSVAVLLDATIVRAVLLPAVMSLLGEANWYLPRWLRWLPKIEHGASGTAPVQVPPVERPVPVGATAS
ncbi:membrane protein [Virgisporangium aliadipatigenens]|uniref:Membrane protein n=1 Tax=Virgisporangium aliadipatigenens TaxID=741659 RepID=A0A8J3YRD9_9ACTN|nr:MMPL family transporter [Virgisporangium aliadipatigenens]GIJ48570.1 membrane protein [Virgisporangium aliadipatigenens]